MEIFVFPKSFDSEHICEQTTKFLHSMYFT